MANNGYEAAFEQASAEIYEIDEQLKHLHVRKVLIDKLLECLTALNSQNKAVEESKPCAEAHASEVSIVEAQPHEHQGNENHGHEHHEHHEHEHQEQHQG